MKEINYKIDDCRNQLSSKHNEIIQEENTIKSQENKLKNDVAQWQMKHQKYTKSKKEAEIEENRNENIIDTHTQNIKINKQMKTHNTDIYDEMVKALQYANEKVSQLQ